MNYFKIYEWNQAPEWAKALSNNGGDEDGVVICDINQDIPWFLERIWDMYGSPQIIEVKKRKLKVVIWAHA